MNRTLTCRSRVISLVLLFASVAAFAKDTSAPKQFSGATPLEWTVRMADSEMARRGDTLAWTEGGRAKWDYTAGLFTLSLLHLNERVPDARYVEFTKRAIGSFIGQDGKIQGYKQEEYNLDNLNAGKTVLALWTLTKEERYRKCAEMLRKQLDTQPRTSEGGFWHKQRYPNQMWLDGIYMGSPFYAEYGKLFNEPAAFDDVAKQIRVVSAHTYDPQTGFFYHGWDESKEQSWANPTTGTSSNFWGRGLGWFAMACVDDLDFLPANHPARPEIIATLKKAAEGLVKHQDPASGLWYQVLDQGNRAGNYLEATASTMFVYALAKGVNRGYLSHDFAAAAFKGYDGIIRVLVKTNSQGRVSLTQCCSVAGLGYGRDGSYEYYLKEPVVENDLKGVGPLILAGIEVQQLAGLPMTPPAKSSQTQAATPKKSTLDAQWKKADKILARIKPPVFRNREFSIVDFGAKSGGDADASGAIASAIEKCAKAGGGRVVVPAGVFLTGPIHLKSGVNLHLDGGATLLFKTNSSAYLPPVLTRFEGMECWNYSPLIYAYGQKNIAVTGEGVLDGQANDSTWWSWKGRRPSADGSPMPPNQTPSRRRLSQMVDQGTPVKKRVFGEGDYLRPSFIEFHSCRNILIEGVRIRRSPMWELHPVLSRNITIRNVNIVSNGPNNDGCDPESCRDVLIEGCLFDTGDDCIAIKSGRNNDGRRVGVAAEDHIIRNCTMKEGHGGVTIGSEISGGCRNVYVENCEMDSPTLDRVLRFKSNAVRGGVVENVFMRNVSVGRVADAVLQIDFAYEEGTNGVYKPVVRNVVMENITVRETPRVLNVVGIPRSTINDIRVVNSTFNNVKRDNVVKDAGDVKLADCTIQRAEAANSNQ